MAKRYYRRMSAKLPGTCPRCRKAIVPGQTITHSPTLHRWIHVQCRAGAPKYRGLAEARWPRAEWIAGNGRWATVAPCRDCTTVELHATLEAAERAKAQMDRTGCGGFCQPGRHQLIDLED